MVSTILKERTKPIHPSHKTYQFVWRESLGWNLKKHKKRMVSTILKERTKPIYPSHKTYQFVWRESPGWDLKKNGKKWLVLSPKKRKLI
jgi:hypothetical protein